MVPWIEYWNRKRALMGKKTDETIKRQETLEEDNFQGGVISLVLYKLEFELPLNQLEALSGL